MEEMTEDRINLLEDLVCRSCGCPETPTIVGAHCRHLYNCAENLSLGNKANFSEEELSLISAKAIREPSVRTVITRGMHISSGWTDEA